MLIGRIFQYIGVAISVYAAVTNVMAGDMAMAIGQSLALIKNRDLRAFGN